MLVWIAGIRIDVLNDQSSTNGWLDETSEHVVGRVLEALYSSLLA